MKGKKSVIGQIPKGIWVLGLISMLMDISSEMIHSLLPIFMLTNLGMSAVAIGLVEGLAEATAMLVKVFSGCLSDYFAKRKGLILLGYSLGALAKPVFALASSMGLVLAAKFIDKIGKGIRGAPRDALVADLAPEKLRGASFGLRQALDTLGACFGPLLASALLLLWCEDFRMIFWLALVPALLAVLLVLCGIREAERKPEKQNGNPVSPQKLGQLGPACWRVLLIGTALMLARFSEAFLILRAQQLGIPISLVPLVMLAMHCIYALSAYPFGKLADSKNPATLLIIALGVLFAADLCLAQEGHWSIMLAGIACWGIHMGMSQGLLAAMLANAAPQALRGTAFGCLNLVTGASLLVSSLVAGLVWDSYGASFVFYTGAVFCITSMLLLVKINKPLQH